jgi:hypothetical protein
VRTNAIQNRVLAIRIEVGADACEIDRRAYECFANAVAGWREIVSVLIIINKANRLNCSAVIVELRRNDFTVATCSPSCQTSSNWTK